MKKARFATGAGVALAAFLFGVPFVSDQSNAIGSILDFADFICFGAHSADGGTDATSGGHDHSAPGLYMPMFSTPPKGGAIYNGPPLDEC